MHHRNIVILCCYGVIFVAFVIVLMQEYFGLPYPTEEKAKRVRIRAYVTILIAYTVMAIARWAK